MDRTASGALVDAPNRAGAALLACLCARAHTRHVEAIDLEVLEPVLHTFAGAYPLYPAHVCLGVPEPHAVLDPVVGGLLGHPRGRRFAVRGLGDGGGRLRMSHSQAE